MKVDSPILIITIINNKTNQHTMKIFKPSELEAEILFEALGNRKELDDFTESGDKNIEDTETFYEENGNIFTYYKVTSNDDEKTLREDYRLLMTAKELEEAKLQTNE